MKKCHFTKNQYLKLLNKPRQIQKNIKNVWMISIGEIGEQVNTNVAENTKNNIFINIQKNTQHEKAADLPFHVELRAALFKAPDEKHRTVERKRFLSVHFLLGRARKGATCFIPRRPRGVNARVLVSGCGRPPGARHPSPLRGA